MAVIGLASAVAGFVKIRHLVDKAVIDNAIFRMHYRVTSAILFLSCVIVTANNLIGDPINCIGDGAIDRHVINTYCWITYTFTMPSHRDKPIGSHVAYPGVGPVIPGEEPIYHSYYQWVPFVLFFQGILFYGPHYIWKNYEDGKMRMLTEGMRGPLFHNINSEERISRQKKVASYITDSLHTNNYYSSWYFLCEFLNFVNVIGNIFFVNRFLGGAFLDYGTDVLRFSELDQENRTDPMIAVFPRVTKCTFHKYGPSGSIQRHDTLCILALNILNEKIYIFLWFWFIILAVFTAIAIVLSAAVILMPNIREAVIRRKYRPLNNANNVPTLVRKTQLGDFLIVYLLGQNVSETVYSEVMEEVCQNLENNSNGPPPSAMLSAPPTAPPGLEMSNLYPTVEKRTDV
ncbi:innexin inx3 [Neocloeon triangulifer]|uniref:innexin inx3 n=1 Tax=Neocloeon triangulifer TaxID=2078957 RepID=UPI00286F5FAB|nr:innexin inx3 [Neocloeon triangulifer]